MNIYGLQKTTLLDYPGKVACTVFTGGCNLRCPFCHNAGLVYMNTEIMDYDKVLSFLKKRAGILDGLCVTGGEPLLNRDISVFLKSARDMGYMIKLDTNGSFPDRLKELVSDRLVDYVAMDIKNSRALYGKTAGIPDFDALSSIEESISFLIGGTVDYEFRTTVVSGLHTKESIRALAEWIQGAKRYYLQGFVDSGNIIGDGISAVSEAQMKEFLRIAREFVPAAEIRGI